MHKYEFNNFISSISFGDVIFMSVSFDSSCRELKRDIIMLNHCVDFFAGIRGRGYFLMNLSMGPGGSF